MDQLVNFIIRPPRADYSPKDDLLDETFRLRRRWYRRKDLEVINGQGKELKCSHYLPLIIPEGKSLPCVIYCHGNSGCRADASVVAVILLPLNITVFTLDFSGSGLSEGEHVTLGWNEKEDLKAVVNHLSSDGSVSFIGLWGHSMGAVTSLMYGAEDPSIAGMVLDSPFSNLVELMMELVMYKYPLPKFTVKLAIQHIRRIIKKKAYFDIMDLDAIEVAKRCFVPALFGHATDDDFIRPHHSERICDAYMGDKNIIKFEGDNNSPRPQFYFDAITIFFCNVLNPPDDLPEDDHFLPEDHYINQDIGYRNPSLSDLLTGNGAVTTEDAIDELLLRQLMSQVEVPSGTPTKENDISDRPSSLVPSRADLTPMMEDADFLEYSFDSYAEIPCTAADEERNLKDLGISESINDELSWNPKANASNQTDDTTSMHMPEHIQNEPNNQKEEKPTPRSEFSESMQSSSKQLKFEIDNSRNREDELDKLKDDSPTSQSVGYFAEFNYSELKDATNNLHGSFKIGQGGFGTVYKGTLHKTTVAIKMLKDGSSQGTKEFNMEVEILSKVRHPNLITLIGACAETRALIYEYLPNGSLEDRLKCKNNTPPLSWQNRVRIAFEICSALNFLHCTKPHGIAHGDLKPDNILLDSNNVSKISDFGLSRQLNYTDSASVPFHETDCPKGTLAYMDPEYFSTWKMTPQYDIYAFGIILLRMVTGKDPRGIRILVEEAQEKDKLKTLIDSSAGAWPFKEAMKMISLGLRCSHPVRKNRPNLSTEVWSEIESMVDVASASVPSLFSRLAHRH